MKPLKITRGGVCYTVELREGGAFMRFVYWYLRRAGDSDVIGGGGIPAPTTRAEIRRAATRAIVREEAKKS